MAVKKINQLPVKTWNRLGMNDSALGEEDVQLLDSAEQSEPIRILTKSYESTERMLHLECIGRQSKAQTIELTAEKDSALTVWTEIASEEDADGLLNLTTKVQAQAGAKVRLVQVQLLGKQCRLVNSVQTVCEEGADIALLQIFLGSAKTWTELRGALNKPESNLSVQLGYWLKDAQKLDMNYVTVQKAQKTKSEILAKGVLEDSAHKLFRGTIDFQKGSAGSEGLETEEILMLGEDAVNQTIPLILCAEEDVQGNHGATIGEPDEDTLFYLASRGIGKEEAVNLLARMKIEGLRVQIGNEALEKKVQDYLEGVVNHAE